MIRYKVISCDRTSSIVRATKYTIKYTKGKTVRAKKGTLGIFCFKTRGQAMCFIDTSEQKIIKVKTFGRGKAPKKILNWAKTGWNSALTEFYKKNYNIYHNDINEPPVGTICYPKVEVLE